jgi:pimeloyl-ACP methyl ester carboxylesterase
MEHLEQIDVPTLLELGADDARYQGGMEYLGAKVPRAKLVVVEQAGHAVNLYQPAAFNAAVLAFLKDNDL